MLYWGYLAAAFLASALPRAWSYALASTVADIWYARSSRLRRNLDLNLSLIPALARDPGGRRKIARRSARNFALAIVDFLCLPSIDRDNLDRLVDVDSFRSILPFLGGRPALAVTAHLGNWEIAAATAAMLGIKLHVIVFDHPDPRVASFFRTRREAKGLKVMSVRSAARDLPAVLETSWVGLAGDRDFTGQGITVPFFGTTTTVPSGYAGLAVLKNIPVIPVFCLRFEDGRYHLEFEPPIAGPAGESPSADEIVSRCLEAFEKCIEKYPEQWYRFDKVGSE
jgi:KDO2-lipid IV(A) lauroyltransferase